MPFKGLTWSRFKEHLRKTSPIYIVGFIVCVLLTNLIYTTTRPQTPADREVLVYLVDSFSDPDPLNACAEDILAYGQTIDETLEEVRFESIQFNDPEQDYTSAYLIMARMSVGDGDVYLASATATDYLLGAQIGLPLERYLDEGWLEEYDLEPVSYTDPETGETSVVALRLDDVDGLLDIGSFNNEGACMFIASNGTNVDTSMQVAEYVIQQLMEGNYAPAESVESAD